MNLLHDAYTALLSGLTHRTGSEIHWYDDKGNPITVEPVDVESESYVVRYYYNYGSLYWEISYIKDQLHGKVVGWHENGQKHWEDYYYKDQRHGKFIEWYNSGQKKWEINYVNDQRHGKLVRWHKNGQECVMEDYYKGQLHGKSMWRFEDGTFWHENYYIDGKKVTRKKWEQHNESTT